MTTEHLSDTDIQLFVFDKGNADPGVVIHVLHCPHCAAKVEQYRTLAEGLAGQEKAVFDFHLATVVMDSLPRAKPKRRPEGLIIGLSLLMVATICFIPWRFFKMTTLIAAALIGTTTLCMMAFLLTDMYRIYKKQVKFLSI